MKSGVGFHTIPGLQPEYKISAILKSLKEKGVEKLSIGRRI